MKNHMRKNRQQGFTLVELAVVMIIIGLLIGGVLKGQELIGNAQVTSTVASVKGMDAAVSTFQDMYSALPGDMVNPAARLPNCTGIGGCNGVGNGNGRLETTPSTLPTVGSEAGRFFVHLAAADLLTGIDPYAGTSFRGIFPEAAAGGGFLVGSSSGAAADFSGVVNGTGMRAGLYLTLNGSATAAPSATTTSLTPNQAARMDRKIDDGMPGVGTVRAFGTGCAEGATAASNYLENSPTTSCGLYLRIQG